MGKPILYLDLEANGFLYEADKVWCVVGYDEQQSTYLIWHVDTEEQICYPKNTIVFDTIDNYLLYIKKYKLVGHNLIAYDLLLLNKLYRFSYPIDEHSLEDTYLLSCLYNPDRVYGHSLEDWGNHLSFKKGSHTDWTCFSQQMLTYCIQDVDVTRRVSLALSREKEGWDWSSSVDLEYRFADILSRQELYGVAFDKEGAERLYEQICEELNTIESTILSQIPAKATQVGATVDRPFKKDGSYRENVNEWIRGTS